MIRYYRVRDKSAFIAGVQAVVGATLNEETPAPLAVTGQPTGLDELSARRPLKDRQFSLVELSVLNNNGPTVTAQDSLSGNWVKISPDSGNFIIQEVSE